jgi:hypothetical protein
MSSGNSVIFNGCEIRYLDLRRDEGGVFSRIHIAFSPSEPVMQAMGWDPWPDSIPRGPLTGRLAGTHLILTPTDKALKKHEIQFGVNEVRDFSFTSETNDQGHIISRTIRATVVTGEKIAAIIENWLSVVGEASAVAKIGYTVQQQLPGTEVVADKQKVLQMQPAAEEDSEPTPIDNALNAAGSGRERKKRTRANSPQFVDHSAPSPEEAAAVERHISESLQ